MQINHLLASSKVAPTDIEIFLAHLLGKDRSFVKAFPEFQLNNHQAVKFKAFIKRRLQHEPLAYILGYKEFCGVTLNVDRRVMIPRPETEELVNQVVSQVYALPNRNRANHWKYKQLKIVDVGAGSGNIAISLAKAIPFAKIYAVEKYPDALKLARENIRLHKVAHQIELVEGHLLDPIRNSPAHRQTGIDIVVANLPYIPQARLSKLPPEISKWEPRVALDGGKDGLELYRDLFKQIPRVLRPGGQLFYEIDGEIFTKIH